MRDGARTRGRSTWVVALVGALGVASCLAGEPTSEPTTNTTVLAVTSTALPSTSAYAWGEEAELWTAGFAAAVAEHGGEQFARMFAPGSSHDFRSMDPDASFEVIGRSDTLFLFESIVPAGTEAYVSEGWPLVSLDGLLSFSRLDWGISGVENLPSVTDQLAHLGSILVGLGPRGAREMITAMSVDSLRERGSGPHIVRSAERIVEEWMAAWGVPDPEIRSANAIVSDSIGGRSLAGASESTPPGAWQISHIGDGPAIYPLSFERGRFDGAIFVVETSDPAYCPNRLGVVVTVDDDERIVREDRYWLPAEARRCLAPSELPDGGWWVGIDLVFHHDPVVIEDLETVTATLLVGDHVVELINSSPNLERAAAWAFDRFVECGLEPPVVSSITFTDTSEVCHDAQAHTSWQTGVWRVELCFGDDDLCVADCAQFRTWAKRALLHELGHAWLTQNLAVEVRNAYMRSLGLDVWADSSVPWELHAREHAAETIAWGLLDTDMRMFTIGSPTDPELTLSFRLLTGEDPLPKGNQTEGADGGRG